MTIRESLKTRLEAMGVSQADLAREAETTTASLCRFLNAPPSRSEQYAANLSDALDRIEKRAKRRRK